MVDEAGNVEFPVYPSITTELWKKVQSIDPRIIQLSHVEGALVYRNGWDESVSAIATCGDPDMTFTSRLKVWHADNKMPFSRSVCGGIIMPSKYFIANLENKGFKTLEQLREVVDPVRQQYQSMMVNMDGFMTENPHFAKEPEAIMDIMDSFYRLIPLPVRVAMCFKCTCTKGFVSFACEHSTIATMLFDPRLEVPQSADITKLKEKPAKI